MSLFGEAIEAPFKMIDQGFDAMDKGFDTVFGSTQSRGRRRPRRVVHMLCPTCQNAGYVAVPDASGAMVAVPCPHCEKW